MPQNIKYPHIFFSLVFLFFCCTASEGFAKQNKKNHALTGKASWYGKKFHGRHTASGTVYDMHTQTAAHRTLPFGTVVEVIDQKTPLRTVVCITDRGPFIRGRVIDLSQAAAEELDLGIRGITSVKLRILTDEYGNSLHIDEAFFVQITPNEKKKKGKKESIQKENTYIGPYTNFADAVVMRDVLMQTYPQLSIIFFSVDELVGTENKGAKPTFSAS